jgi:hypothetical protein
MEKPKMSHRAAILKGQSHDFLVGGGRLLLLAAGGFAMMRMALLLLHVG